MIADQDTILGGKESITRSHFIVLFLQQNSSTVFLLDPWPIQFQVLGYPSSAGYRFNFMGWALSPVSQWLLIPTSLCHYCTNISHRQVTIVDQMLCSWARVYFSPLVACRVPSCTRKNQSVGATAVIRQQLDFSMFNELCVGVFFSNRALPSVCGEHSRILAIAWVVLSSSMGSLWLRAQLDITHSWHWKFQLIVRDVLGLCLSCYLVILFRSFSCMYIVYILRSFCCIRFSYHFSNGPQV